MVYGCGYVELFPIRVCRVAFKWDVGELLLRLKGFFV